MRSLGLSVLIVLATAACGANAGGTTDRSGGVSQEQADETMTVLCDIAEGRVTAFEEARASFQNRAHETLHHVAAAAQEEDTASAAALLEAKSVVETDLEQDQAPAELAVHTAALADATAGAIRLIGLAAEPCSG
ncbi:MAG TPA: hypothetical protein VJ913_04125 [Actinomycetota bacterium]|nr:hypothetical protein [Actinomycetota bacterium]